MAKENLGHQPKSKALRATLAGAYFAGSDVDQVIVHHYTDRPEGLQMDFELRIHDESSLGGQRCEFRRIFLP
jgi:hypothetical protein